MLTAKRTKQRATAGKGHRLTTFDMILSVTVMGLFMPAVTTISFWWGSIPLFRDDRAIMICAFAGLLTGILLDLTVLRKHLLRLFELDLLRTTLLSLFYSVMIYGFFMGFPAFNSLMGIIGSYVLVKGGMSRDEEGQMIRTKVKTFLTVSSLTLLVLCVCTAWLALREETIRSQVKNMLGLPFDVTMRMIWALIILGGAFLLAFQCIGSWCVVKSMLKRHEEIASAGKTDV